MDLNVLVHADPVEAVLEAFVKGLITATLANDVLTVDGSNLLDRATVSDIRGNQMYYRPVYDQLFASFDFNIGLGRAIILTGTPGVGKTSCVNPYVRKLLRTPFKDGEQVRTIIIQEGKHTGAFFITMERVGGAAPSTATRVDLPPPAPGVAAAPIVHVTVSVAKRPITTMETILIGDMYHLIDVDEGCVSFVHMPSSLRVAAL